MDATTPIPTMSQWGVLIFALLILNLSVVFMRRLAFVDIQQVLYPTKNEHYRPSLLRSSGGERD